MDFINVDGSIMRITEDRLEGINADGTVLFSFRHMNPIPQFEDLAIGEYEFKELPGGVIAMRRGIKEVNNR